MVEYGLRVKNVNGFVQIDGSYANLALVEILSLTATTQAGGPNGVVWIVRRNFPGYITPTIAIAANNNVAVCCSGRIVNGVWQVTFWASTRTAFQVYVFDEASRGTRFNIDYGLMVKNKTTGAVVFDSRMKYMRVIDVIAGTSDDFKAVIRSYPNAKKVAVVQGLFWAYSFHQIVPDDPVDPTAIASILASASYNPTANSMTLDVMSVYENANRLSQNPIPNWYCPTYSYLVLDVSDFD